LIFEIFIFFEVYVGGTDYSSLYEDITQPINATLFVSASEGKDILSCFNNKGTDKCHTITFALV
jgi:hypothetical protein